MITHNPASSFRRLAAAAIASAVAAALLLFGAVAARADDLVRVPVAGGSLVGTFFAPADGKRHPAIVVLGGSEGGLHDDQARVLAEHGYAALALAYFGIDPLPGKLRAIPVETVSRGIDWLVARAEVDGARIGILGTSKGGELALLAASREPRIRATAAIVPSAYVWFDLAFDGGGETSSWSAAGAPVAYIPSDPAADMAVGRAFAGGGAVSFRDTFSASYAAASTAVRERATIPVEKIAGAVLCIAGGDDREWDSPAACTMVRDRRHAAGRDAKDEAMVEPGAGHALPFSGKPAPGSYPAGLATIVLGGTPEANGRGGADARDRVIAFFNKVLGAK
ncbi:MAG TPA: acyl-CoA thioester hydrolase/BAAT C-terminal domain-containing protein [Xanthomonadales bacterium]|nr:acyl-CoA thioester hydrolase/BAAT C-terminal domain-containing protein [Xanthomonadales bacterium]